MLLFMTDVTLISAQQSGQSLISRQDRVGLLARSGGHDCQEEKTKE
jgi:hypothetical protein